MTDKDCLDCGNTFTAYTTAKRCKECRVTHSKLYAKQKYKELQSVYLSYLSENGCAACNENHPLALEVHHINVDTKRWETNRGQDCRYNIDDINQGLAMVLCASCHSIFHRHYGGKNSPFPVQTFESTVGVITKERKGYSLDGT